MVYTLLVLSYMLKMMFHSIQGVISIQKGDFLVFVNLFYKISLQNILKYGLVVFTSCPSPA